MICKLFFKIVITRLPRLDRVVLLPWTSSQSFFMKCTVANTRSKESWVILLVFSGVRPQSLRMRSNAGLSPSFHSCNSASISCMICSMFPCSDLVTTLPTHCLILVADPFSGALIDNTAWRVPRIKWKECLLGGGMAFSWGRRRWCWRSCCKSTHGLAARTLQVVEVCRSVTVIWAWYFLLWAFLIPAWDLSDCLVASYLQSL